METRHDSGRSWVAWGAPALLIVWIVIYQAISAFFPGLVCQTVNSGEAESICGPGYEHPAVALLSGVIQVGGALLIAISIWLAIRKRLNGWGWVGLAVSVAVLCFVVWVYTQSGNTDTP